MRFHRFPSVFRNTLGAGMLALFASLILATALQGGDGQAATGGLKSAATTDNQPRTASLLNPKSQIQNHRLVEAYGKLPLSFEINQGQTDSQVKFLSRGPGYTLFLTGEEAVLSLRSQESEVRRHKSALSSRKLEIGNWKLADWESAIWNLQSSIAAYAANEQRTTDNERPVSSLNPKSKITNPKSLRPKSRVASPDGSPPQAGWGKCQGQSDGNGPPPWQEQLLPR
jgi:hypothetical protein